MKLIGKNQGLFSGGSNTGIFIFVLIINLLPVQWVAAGNYSDLNASKGQNQNNQIVINPSMIHNESNGTEDIFAGVLADEQFCVPGSGWQPQSQAWTPLNISEESIYVDLGETFSLTQMGLYHLAKTKGLEIWTGAPGNWNYLMTVESKDQGNWEMYAMNTNTRFIKLKASAEASVSVNELQFFGNECSDLIAEKSGMIPGIEEKLPGETLQNNGQITLSQNLSGNQLYLNIPDEDDFSHNFTIELYDLNGTKLLQTEYIYNMSTRILVDITNTCDRCGVYILRYYNSTGIQRTMKFIKKH